VNDALINLKDLDREELASDDIRVEEVLKGMKMNFLGQF
jgi:hypothetical protein